jgi:nucleoside-diphosphate-sugar epimerase
MVPTGTTLCWRHVEDTAGGHLLAMQRGKVGESYIIAGPPCTVTDVLWLAERITGVPYAISQMRKGRLLQRAARASSEPDQNRYQRRSIQVGCFVGREKKHGFGHILRSAEPGHGIERR